MCDYSARNVHTFMCNVLVGASVMRILNWIRPEVSLLVFQHSEALQPSKDLTMFILSCPPHLQSRIQICTQVHINWCRRQSATDQLLSSFCIQGCPCFYLDHSPNLSPALLPTERPKRSTAYIVVTRRQKSCTVTSDTFSSFWYSLTSLMLARLH